MGFSYDISTLLENARDALATSTDTEALEALHALKPQLDEVGHVEAVDLLERASTFGRLACVEALYDMFGEFAYSSWALALALRCAQEDVARLLLAKGVDLLGPVTQPTRIRVLVPHEGTFTRFDLTRTSPTLFLNPMDPTVSTEVFEPFGRPEHLAGHAYAAPTDLARTCGLVARLASEGLFDPLVFDDLFRAAMVKAWHALRHAGSRDQKTAAVCLDLGRHLLGLHRERGMGDKNVELLLGNLIVPKVDPDIVAFVCEEEPGVFLERLAALSWLRDDAELVRAMVGRLAPASQELNGVLLRVLARNGYVRELRMLEGWSDTLTPANLAAAIDEAASAGHAEASAWLLAHGELPSGASAQASLDDLFL